MSQRFYLSHGYLIGKRHLRKRRPDDQLYTIQMRYVPFFLPFVLKDVWDFGFSLFNLLFLGIIFNGDFELHAFKQFK